MATSLVTLNLVQTLKQAERQSAQTLRVHRLRC